LITVSVFKQNYTANKITNSLVFHTNDFYNRSKPIQSRIILQLNLGRIKTKYKWKKTLALRQFTKYARAKICIHTRPNSWLWKWVPINQTFVCRL